MAELEAPPPELRRLAAPRGRAEQDAPPPWVYREAQGGAASRRATVGVGWRSWKLHLLGHVAKPREVRRLAAPNKEVRRPAASKKLGRKSR